MTYSHTLKGGGFQKMEINKIHNQDCIEGLKSISIYRGIKWD